MYEHNRTVIVGSLGSLANSSQLQRRTGHVTMRVGSTVLDNTQEKNRSSGISSGLIPLRDDRAAMAAE